MKKIFALIVSVIFCAQVDAQTTAGDLYFGAQGTYITNYKTFAAGVRSAYHFSNPFQLNLAINMNPWITMEEDNNAKFDVQVYNVDLNAHFYVINHPNWGMAPVVGACYYYAKEKRVEGAGVYDGGTDSEIGLNLGWDIRYEFSENWRVSGFWKYSMLGGDNSHHTFGLGLGYHFNTF